MERWRVTRGAAGQSGTPLSAAVAASGMTVIELLVGLGVLSVLGAMLASFLHVSVVASRVLAARIDAQETASMTVDIVGRELRMAGFNAGGPPVPALRDAAADRVEVAADFNGDGDVDDMNETVAYSHNADRSLLMRATGGGSPQPWLRDVPAGGFRVTYRDADGRILPVGVGLSAEQRDSIRRIDVELAVEVPHPTGQGSPPVRAAATTSVHLRNGGR
jgi:hypothetical protein